MDFPCDFFHPCDSRIWCAQSENCYWNWLSLGLCRKIQFQEALREYPRFLRVAPRLASNKGKELGVVILSADEQRLKIINRAILICD